MLLTYCVLLYVCLSVYRYSCDLLVYLGIMILMKSSEKMLTKKPIN